MGRADKIFFLTTFRDANQKRLRWRQSRVVSSWITAGGMVRLFHFGALTRQNVRLGKMRKLCPACLCRRSANTESVNTGIFHQQRNLAHGLKHKTHRMALGHNGLTRLATDRPANTGAPSFLPSCLPDNMKSGTTATIHFCNMILRFNIFCVVLWKLAALSNVVGYFIRIHHKFT